MRSNTPAIAAGSGAAYSMNSKPSVPVGFSQGVNFIFRIVRLGREKGSPPDFDASRVRFVLGGAGGLPAAFNIGEPHATAYPANHRAHGHSRGQGAGGSRYRGRLPEGAPPRPDGVAARQRDLRPVGRAG